MKSMFLASFVFISVSGVSFADGPSAVGEISQASELPGTVLVCTIGSFISSAGDPHYAASLVLKNGGELGGAQYLLGTLEMSSKTPRRGQGLSGEFEMPDENALVHRETDLQVLIDKGLQRISIVRSHGAEAGRKKVVDLKFEAGSIFSWLGGAFIGDIDDSVFSHDRDSNPFTVCLFQKNDD